MGPLCGLSVVAYYVSPPCRTDRQTDRQHDTLTRHINITFEFIIQLVTYEVGADVSETDEIGSAFLLFKENVFPYLCCSLCLSHFIL